jgi:hypothetical protein
MMKIIYLVLTLFATLLRIRCFKPRLRPGVASMSPMVIRDRFAGMYCQKWRFHLGPCEARRGEAGEVEQWTPN